MWRGQYDSAAFQNCPTPHCTHPSPRLPQPSHRRSSPTSRGPSLRARPFTISEARQPPAQPPITLQLPPFHYDRDTTPTDPPPPPPASLASCYTRSRPLCWTHPDDHHHAPITPQPSICSLTVALHYPFTHNLLTTTMIILLSSIVLLNPILGSELTRVRDPKPGGFEAPAAAIANRKPQWPMLMDDMKRGALGGGLGQLRRSRKDDDKDDNTGCG